ncbi:MAG: hypothetical protein KDK70_19855 [Myxococcales bacterium]|nr:hypothetical protein [Myxococcales bacterium]
MDEPGMLPGRVPAEIADSGEDDGDDSGAPGHHGEGDAETPAGRRVRRMSADQFHASLVMVTGQPWPSFAEYAGAMGKADFAEITEEGRELSVTFDKFVHDAAMYSCDAAVEADVAAAGAGAGVVLRWAELSDRDQTVIRRNLDYLVLRFLGQEMKPDDVRVEPWMNLLTATPDEGELDDALMQERWTAVCVGLVTHPDFVTY